MINTTMSKIKASEFFDDINFESIVSTIKGIYTSDGSMSTLLDFERVLDESDLYAFRNWELGELVAGPNVKRYTVDCTFMYPLKLMPDPRGAKRLLSVGCNIKFKKTKIKVPIEINNPSYLMNDIREGSIDLAGQNIDLDELDSAYENDLDTDGNETEDNQTQGMGPDMGAMGGMPPAPGQPPALGGM